MKTRTTYLLDRMPGVFEGTTIDLTREQVDVYGARWIWTGLVTPDRHVPLMQSGTDTPLPLDEVYATYGPLIPAPAPLTAAAVRAVLAPVDPDPQCMECHDIGCTACVRPPLPARPVLRSPAAATTATVYEPKPDERPAAAVPSPSTFARFLARIRGGAGR
jgi:hypothetical protein